MQGAQCVLVCTRRRGFSLCFFHPLLFSFLSFLSIFLEFLERGGKEGDLKSSLSRRIPFLPTRWKTNEIRVEISVAEKKARRVSRRGSAESITRRRL